MHIATTRLFLISTLFHFAASTSINVRYFANTGCKGDLIGCFGITSLDPFCCGVGSGPDGKPPRSSDTSGSVGSIIVEWFRGFGGCNYAGSFGSDSGGKCHTWPIGGAPDAGRTVGAGSGDPLRKRDGVCTQQRPNMIILAEDDGSETKIPIPEGQNDLYETLFFRGHKEALVTLAKNATRITV